jgi:hypothetical protein
MADDYLNTMWSVARVQVMLSSVCSLVTFCGIVNRCDKTTLYESTYFYCSLRLCCLTAICSKSHFFTYMYVVYVVSSVGSSSSHYWILW